MISLMMMSLSLSPPLYRYQQTVILAISAVSLSPPRNKPRYPGEEHRTRAEEEDHSKNQGIKRGSFSYFAGNVVWLEVHNPWDLI
jgi:hypothetical protein